MQKRNLPQSKTKCWTCKGAGCQQCEGVGMLFHCYDCPAYRPASYFSKREYSTNGKQPRCRECEAKRQGQIKSSKIKEQSINDGQMRLL